MLAARDEEGRISKRSAIFWRKNTSNRKCSRSAIAHRTARLVSWRGWPSRIPGCIQALIPFRALAGQVPCLPPRRVHRFGRLVSFHRRRLLAEERGDRARHCRRREGKRRPRHPHSGVEPQTIPAEARHLAFLILLANWFARVNQDKRAPRDWRVQLDPKLALQRVWRIRSPAIVCGR